MKTLYLLNRKQPIHGLQALLGPQDSLVLCGEAVLAWQQDWPDTLTVCLMQEDVQARNLTLPPGLQQLDYVALVELCTGHDRVIAW